MKTNIIIAILIIILINSQTKTSCLYPKNKMLPSGFEPEITALRGQYA